MTVIELKRELIRVRDEARSLLDLEDRTAEQAEEASKLVSRCEELQTEIETREKLDAYNPGDPEPSVRDIKVKDRPERPFRSFGEQLQAIIRASLPGGHRNMDQRLLPMREETEQRAPTGLGETFPGAGGFLVQTDFSTALLQNTMETGLLYPRCRKVTISSGANAIQLPMVNETSRATTRAGGILAYWKDEAALKVASQPEFRMIELKLNKLIGLCWLTDELMQDVTALEGFVSAEFAKEFGFQIDDAIIRGTGAGQPLGILPAPALVTIAAEVGQAVDTVVTQNIQKMRAAMPYSSRGNAIWLINQGIEPQLQSMSLAVGTGGVPTYMPQNGLSSAPYDTLYGAPVLPIEQCSALGNVGDIIYADFSQYLIAEKGGMETASSIHVHFEYDETVLRFVLRMDGQPIPSTPLTPYLGTAASISPFVTLAAR